MNCKNNALRGRTLIRALGIPLTLVVSAWAVAAHGQATTGWSPTAGGTYSYSDTNNWVGSNPNGIWHSTLALAGGQTITVNSDLILGHGLSFGNSGNSGITLRGTGANRTLTLGGDIVHTAGTSATILFGSTGTNEALNIDLGGVVRNITAGSGRTLGFVNAISNGGIFASGGTLNFSGANTYAGTTTIISGLFSLNGASGSSANSDIKVKSDGSGQTTLRFNSGTSGNTGITRAKSVTLNGTGRGDGIILSVTGNGTVNSNDTITNAITAEEGYAVVTLSPNSARNTRLTAGSFVREAGSTLLIRGQNLGVNAATDLVADSSNLMLASAPELAGDGSAGSSTVGIMRGVYGATTTGGTGSGLVTYDADKGVRLLNIDTEYTAAIVNGQTQKDNVRYVRASGGASQDIALSTGTTSINSLSFNITGAGTNSGVTISGATGAVLKIHSGMIFANQTVTTAAASDAMVLSVPTLDLNGQEGVVIAFTNGVSQANTAAPLQINSVITNDGGKGVTFGGTGQTILGGAEANTYTGVTTLNSGILRLNKSVANIGLTTDFVMNGGTLLKNSNAIADTASVTINGGTFWMDSTSSSGNNNHTETINNFTMNGGSFGNHGSNATLNINGNATLTDSELGMNAGGDITVLGTTTLSGGVLRAKESSSTTVFNALTSLKELVINNVASGAYTAIIVNSNATNKGAQLTLGGDVTFNGNASNQETVKIATSNAADANQGVVRLDGTRTFNIGDGAAAADLTVETSLTDATVAGGLNKTGAGTLALKGDSTYTGATTVTQGRLLVNNTTGSGAGLGNLTVNAGATLGGTGRVVAAAGKSLTFHGLLDVGDSTLTTPAAADFELRGDTITFSSTSRLEFDLFGGSGDGLGINITGVDADLLLFGTGQGLVDIASGATLHVDAADTMTAWAVGDTWKLIDWSQVSATSGSFAFSSSVDGLLAGMGLAWDTSQLHSQGTISIAAAPEPSRSMMAFVALLAAAFRRSRPRGARSSWQPAWCAALLAFLCMGVMSVTAQEPAPKTNLVSNGDFTLDADGDSWPDGWGKGTGLSWEKDEAGKPFFRITATESNKMLSAYREVPIPAGVVGIEVAFKYRTADVKKGKQSWNDARAMFHFLNQAREQVKPTPSPIVFSTKATEWTEITRNYMVPEGVTALQMMPSLFQTESGRLDFAEIRVTPLNPEQIEALKKADAERAAKKAEMDAKVAAKRREQAAALLAKEGTLLSNGNFETENKKKDSPEGWGKGGGITWEKDESDGNRFIRLTSLTPGKTVLLFRDCPVPEGAAALEMTWKQRITGFKKGPKPWFDARIMLEFKGADGKTLPSKPSPPYSQKDTDGWVEKRAEFLVPAEAVSLVVMPALFEVKSGSFDLDNIVLKPTDANVLLAKQKEREILAEKSRVPLEEPNQAKWPPAIRAEGNRIVTVDGGKEVWLQGLNVPSLEWSLRGEQVYKSVVVGIEEWKGNVIRLPIKDDYWFGKDLEDGGKAYRAVVDQVITLASNRGAYVVLDLHRYRAPRKEHLDFWKDAAARYKNHPSLIFDLINEPHGVTWEVWRDGGFVEEKRKDGDEDAFLTPEEKLHNKHGFQSPGMQAMLDAVRSTGAKNMVLVGGLDYAYQLDGIMNGFGLKDEGGQGIIYACHIYPWKRGWQKYLLDAAEKYPILLGEVGADAKKMDFMPHEMQENAETWVPDMLGLIQKHRLNWTGWCFHPSASPRMLVDWNYTPTPVWGQPAKEALAGKKFELHGKLR